MLRAAVLFVILAFSVPGPSSFERRELPYKTDNAPGADKLLPETMPGGVAAFDYDGDGRPDIFFASGTLLHNEGAARFTDVSQDSGFGLIPQAMGVAVADYDADGRPDIFVTTVNGGRLFRNLGNGRFEDETPRSGITTAGWSVAAGWLDYDGDGYLDLFVVNYLQWDPAKNPVCRDPGGKIRVYCHPRNFAGRANQLFRNQGDGTFQDVSTASGIGKFIGKGMSLAIADYDADGFPDVYVTNDTQANFLFHNLHNGTFEEVAFAAGVALPDDGKPVSSMGVEFRDMNNDGLPDLLYTALTGESFPVFRNMGRGQFRDAGYATGLSRLTARLAGWGIAAADFDNDGWKDVLTANGHVTDNIDQFSGDRYKLPNTLFLNRKGAFVSAPFPACEHSHRGLAVADFDGDGRPDAVVTALGAPAELYLNRMANPNRWLDVKLSGKGGNTDALGASVRIDRQTNVNTSTAGYASAVLGPVHFGLGPGPAGETFTVEVTWPGGRRQTVRKVVSGKKVIVKDE